MELELYIHIPFCIKKCAYCDFLSGPSDDQTIQAYVNRLCDEIRFYGCLFKSPFKKLGETGGISGEHYVVSTIFIGGGTPTILSGAQISNIMRSIKESFVLADDAEITIECNPATIDDEKAVVLFKSGINRISIGLQSANEAELAKLGRIHSYDDFLASFTSARKAGFKNINVDIMSALPGQTVDSYKNTINKVLALRPEHISAYSLIIEEGTPFYEAYHTDDEIRSAGNTPINLPSEEEERSMYKLTEEMLVAKGLSRYEISNYSKPGYECRHNIGYWTGVDYLGLGLGASSMLTTDVLNDTFRDYKADDYDGVRAIRFVNTSSLEEYLGAYEVDEILLEKAADTAALEGGYPVVGDCFAAGKDSSGNAGLYNAGLRNEGLSNAGLSNAGFNIVDDCEADNLDEFLDVEHSTIKLFNHSKPFSHEAILLQSKYDCIEEFMFLGLRLVNGITRDDFYDRFGLEMEAVYAGKINLLKAQGLIKEESRRITLTEYGRDISNYVLAQFLLD